MKIGEKVYFIDFRYGVPFRRLLRGTIIAKTPRTSPSEGGHLSIKVDPGEICKNDEKRGLDTEEVWSGYVFYDNKEAHEFLVEIVKEELSHLEMCSLLESY